MRAYISHREARFVSRFAIVRMPQRRGFNARPSLDRKTTNSVATLVHVPISSKLQCVNLHLPTRHLQHLQHIDLCNPSTVPDWCWQGCLEAWDPAQQQTASFKPRWVSPNGVPPRPLVERLCARGRTQRHARDVHLQKQSLGITILKALYA